LKDPGTEKMDDFYIKKVLDGDYNSFQYFIKTYKKYAFALSFAILKNKEQAEDVLQESFVKAFKSLRAFKKKSKFQTWLGKIVINESLKKARTNANGKAVFKEISENEITVINDSINTLLLEEQRFYISEVFKQLSPNESLALDLFYLNEKSLDEVTEITGWSESKTKMLLLRGRKNFYYRLKGILKTELKEII
jgi:RNA polymerase sigma factor (sigma-70 family)